jgi:mono/diheme cytochrome c family protein
MPDADAQLYTAACATCHYNSVGRTDPHRPELSFVTSLNAAEPTALISVILNGRKSEMPSFAAGFSDSDVARIAAYLRATRTGSPPWPDLERHVATVRATRAAAVSPSGVLKP